VRLMLLHLRELLRPLELRHGVAVNGANAIVVGLSQGDFIGPGLGESVQLICAPSAPYSRREMD
jgi:hypothetical protein